MLSESELKLAGVRALIAALGPVDAECSIAALLCYPGPALPHRGMDRIALVVSSV